jgi:hypothetical protein
MVNLGLEKSWSLLPPIEAQVGYSFTKHRTHKHKRVFETPRDKHNNILAFHRGTTIQMPSAKEDASEALNH